MISISELDSTTPSRSYAEQQEITDGLFKVIAILAKRLGGDVLIDASELAEKHEVFALGQRDGSIRLLERNHVPRETTPVSERTSRDFSVKEIVTGSV